MVLHVHTKLPYILYMSLHLEALQYNINTLLNKKIQSNPQIMSLAYSHLPLSNHELVR